MTSKEAIQTIEAVKAEFECNYPLNYAAAFEVAIKALEKQIPKKPRATEDYPHRLYCPNCYYPFERSKSEIDLIREHFIVVNKYCPECGQALDWSETE